MQEYIKTDRYIHQLSQIIAKANRTFVPEKPDDSHTNLYYDPVGEKLLGRWIESNKRKIMPAFDLNTWHFEIRDYTLRAAHTFPVDGKTVSELEAEIAGALANFGLDTTHYADALHFEIPEYAFKDQPFPAVTGPGLRQWKKIRKLANEACLHMLGYLQASSEIRIWPHHFDTGIYAEVNADTGIGFGLAMADSVERAPNFYLAGYALSGKKIDYTHLPELPTGRWETGRHWNGAVLPIGLLHPMDAPEMAQSMHAFLAAAANWYLQK